MVALFAQQSNTSFPIDEVLHGDCLEVLRSLPSNSVDAIVSDPPAGINFMQKEFDSDRGGRTQWVAWLSEIMQEALRCLKPGGYGLIWALPRTSHWTALALEDAGFIVKDVISHHFGSGFPKSLDISKAIDRMKGAEREVIGISKGAGMSAATPKGAGTFRDDNWIPKGPDLPVTAPATPEAQQWQGYGTALRPSTEFWWLVQKPISEKTIAANVLRWNCGALNIDATRVGTSDNTSRPAGTKPGNTWNLINRSEPSESHPQGRFPSHLLLSHSVWCVPRGVKRVQGNRWGKGNERNGKDGNSLFFGEHAGNIGNGYEDPDGMETIEDWECVEDCPVRLLNEQSGIRSSHHNGQIRIRDFKGWEKSGDLRTERVPVDQGGASRYFQTFHYFSKASRSERNQGCEGLPEEYNDFQRVSSGLNQDRPNREGRKPMGPQSNHHPTVKSLSLMSWLCRLITPPDGIILDPFLGSGSTAVAAIHEGFHFIGIEAEAEYVAICEARIAHAMREVN